MNVYTYVWQVSLQVTSPERPSFKHEVQYRVQALSNERQVAIDKPSHYAQEDGHTVVSVTGAARGYRVKS